MTIDDRLRRAGEQFRGTRTVPAEVHLPAPARDGRTPIRWPRRRLVGLASTVLALVAVTVGVVVWVGSTRPDPRPSGVPASSQASAADLARGPWRLATAENTAGPVSIPPTPFRTLDLRFDPAAGQIAAGDGCNTLTVATRVDGSTLVFSGSSSTAVACARGAALGVAVSEVFTDGSAAWTISGDRLTIRRDGTTLTWDRTEPEPSGRPSPGESSPSNGLTSGTWLLVDVDTGSPPVLHPVIRYTLSIADASAGGQELHLDDDCNLTTVPVDVGGGTFEVSGRALTTAVECNRPDDPAITAANRVFDADVISWSIAGDELTLGGDATTLTFTRA